MKAKFLILTIALAGFTFTGCKKSPTASEPANRSSEESSASAAKPAVPTTPPFAGGRKTSFTEVTSQLDPGGSLFVYLATDQWLAGLSTNISAFRQAIMSLPGPMVQEREKLESAFDLLTRLAHNSGVEEVTGVGLSGAPVAPGLYRNKFILHHQSGAGQGFVWSMFGRSSHALRAQEMLPANTALAAFCDLDVAQLWQVIQRELEQSGIPEAEEAVRAFPQMFEKQTQIAWGPLLASLGGEIGFALTLDEERTISLPVPKAPITIPSPALLLAIKIKNDLLYDHVSALMLKNPQTVKSDEAGLKMCSMPIPLTLPIALMPTVASSGDYLFIATSPELIHTVQAVRQGKSPGLKSSEEFQSLAKYLPAEGNQFVYISKKLGQTVGQIQKQAMGESGLPPEQLAKLQSLLGGAGPSHSLAIGAHTRTGWQTTGVGNKDSASGAFLLPAVAATAVGAAMVLPAIAKAKSRAQAINAVNEVKQLGLAARMYSNDHKDKFPNAQSWCDDLKEYVGNATVYKAPNDSGPGRCSFAYNEKLSGMDEGKIDPQTVLFFEADGGWNRSGGPELMLAKPRSGGSYVVGFADGSVQQMPAARMRSLRWDQ